MVFETTDGVETGADESDMGAEVEGGGGGPWFVLNCAGVVMNCPGD